MIGDKLRKYLFRSDAHTFAVLDGASVPDLPTRLFEMDPPFACLYRGELTPDLEHAAPYVVHIFSEEDPFSEWLLTECWGKHWGIFAQSPLSLTGMRRHFRSLLTVQDEAGNPMLFRFYDPRVLPPFMMTCNAPELEAIFGEVAYYFAELPETNELLRFNFAKEKLVEARLKLLDKA